ncbi:MAG: hypothetical protein WCF98_02485 [Synechococcus sp. ELA057]|jgi:hypothetical protein
MALDPRSRERLEALGRSLPQPLPVPEPRRTRREQAAAPRHPLETEDNPEQLFRELMAASPDGTVPPHHLERLQQLEQARSPRRSSQAAAGQGAMTPPGNGETSGRPSRPGGSKGSAGQGGTAARRRQPGSEEAELYTAFAQLLLEDEELD